MSDKENNFDGDEKASKARVATSPSSYSSHTTTALPTDNESMKHSVKESLKSDKTRKPMVPKILQTYRIESAASKSSSDSDSINVKKLTNEIEVQTEWSWLTDMRLMEKVKRAELLMDESEKHTEIDEELYYSEDEESIVIDEQRSMSKSETPLLESVGPPKILQYIPESEKVELIPPDPEAEASEMKNIDGYMKTLNVNIRGNNTCEFCGQLTKAWPSIQEQESRIPNELYCCTDYREYVEALIEAQTEKSVVNQLINIKPHPKTKNKKEKNLAKQRAEQRRREKEAEREKKRQEILLKEQELALQSDSISTMANNQNDLFTDRSHSTFDPMKSRRSSVTGTATVLTTTGVKRGSKAAQKVPPLQLDNKVEKRDKLPTVKSSRVSSSMTSDNLKNEALDLFDEMPAKQIKAIRYELSNPEYLRRGWTVRNVSPFEFDDISDSEEEADVLVPATIPSAAIKMLEKPLNIRTYKNGNLALIVFPDGTGNVYYESGRLAMTIAMVSRGMHIYTAYTDDPVNQNLLALFDPYGNGVCNYSNGKLRLQMGPLGGVEFEVQENDLQRRKRWLWWDSTNHIHAPPFQPLLFSLNSSLGIKIYNQQKIYISFYAEGQTYTFRAGTKLHISKPEGIPSGFKLDSNEQFLSRMKLKIDRLVKSLQIQIARQSSMSTVMSSIRFPKIIAGSQSVFPQKSAAQSVVTSRSTSKLINLDKESRSRMLNSRSVNDKVSSKASSKFLIVP